MENTEIKLGTLGKLGGLNWAILNLAKLNQNALQRTILNSEEVFYQFSMDFS